MANAIHGIAAVEARTRRAEAAARRLGAAAAEGPVGGWSSGDSLLEAMAVAAAREALGEEEFSRLFGDGRARAGAVAVSAH